MQLIRWHSNIGNKMLCYVIWYYGQYAYRLQHPFFITIYETL